MAQSHKEIYAEKKAKMPIFICEEKVDFVFKDQDYKPEKQETTSLNQEA